ncbi:alpha-ribazole phosphatase family protein [Dinghuibacter silviterrae]|uniref:Alpha-ribazole phosphatase n=1 Tax=Dinghuibacter silviterrae TaxID=1539049 RepID=A0A4R8DRU1_9BACT|nr:alpha-ribazole phosphatase family protein [Dinghuibacter silviterrae]TDX00077.1 alpha-ribazole phosphatase [Dinghuibacter silviterrae]
MTVYLIRHTAPEVPEGTCYGQTDVPLKNTFDHEVENLRNRLRIEVARVVSSPLSRCRSLAQRLWPLQTIETADALKELHFGDWENRAWQDLAGPALDRWMSDFVHERVPNGESYRDLYERCSGWWDEQIGGNRGTQTGHRQAAKNDPAAIVTHAGPLRALLCHVCKTPLEAAFGAYPVPYGAVYQLEEETGHWTARLL